MLFHQLLWNVCIVPLLVSSCLAAHCRGCTEAVGEGTVESACQRVLGCDGQLGNRLLILFPFPPSDALAQCSAIAQSRCHSSSWIVPTMFSIRLWQQKAPWRRQEGNLPSSLEWSGKRWAFQRAILLQVPPGKSEVQSCQVQPSMETYKHVPFTLCYFCVLLLA